MTSTAHRSTRTPAVGVLRRAADSLAARADADVALLVAAVEWAELHPVPAGDTAYAGWGQPDLHGEGVVPIAGDGAPLVAEFAPLELAAVLGWTPIAAQALMGEGLELKHRLPRFWGLVLEQVVPVRLARYAAAQTRDLSIDAAHRADGLLDWDPTRLTRSRIDRLVDEARLYFDPDRAVDDEHQALAARRVELFPGRAPATTDVLMTIDTLDAIAFDRTIAAAAEALKALGDVDALDVRRAKAVGVLADPQRALDLLAGRSPAATPAPATIYLHLDGDTLLDLGVRSGPVTCDRLGVATTDLIKTWLADSTVVIRHVLDLSRSEAVDRHDPPAWMADLVRLRDPECVFPGCHRASSASDLDHIVAYVRLGEGGPPGQTNPHNLAPLCRRHHRAKTHGAWTYHRRDDGSYRWTSPTGRGFDVLPPPRRPRPPHRP